MMEPLLFALFLGAIIGAAIGIFATRHPWTLVRYSATGAAGATLYALLPLLRGGDHVGGAPLFLALFAALFTAAGILFTSAGSRR